jgi:hypothetical protein
MMMETVLRVISLALIAVVMVLGVRRIVVAERTVGDGVATAGGRSRAVQRLDLYLGGSMALLAVVFAGYLVNGLS